MYFERGSYDPSARAEAQTRLQSFQGATSISSSQYFGRDEDEEAAALASSSAAGGGYINEETLQNLGSSARDAVQRVLANPDVQSIGESLRTGALKVRGSVLVDGIEGPDRFWLIAVRLPGAVEPRGSMSAFYLRWKQAHSSSLLFDVFTGFGSSYTIFSSLWYYIITMIISEPPFRKQKVKKHKS
jgi:hypothetical protein